MTIKKQQENYQGAHETINARPGTIRMAAYLER